MNNTFKRTKVLECYTYETLHAPSECNSIETIH